MTARKRRLPDPQTTKNITAFVRAGAFQWVAAVASGVSRAKFAEWMTGQTMEELEFQQAVNEAAAQARVAQETKVAATKPLAWLLRGPGRERPGEPGWTSQVAVTGPKGGALEQIVTQTAQPEEDYSGFTVEELRTLRDLREKARRDAEKKKEAASATPGEV